jgi:enoyl-CoA hydratase/carnithine racemase
MLLRSDDAGVRLLTLNRPEALNACNTELYQAFAGALREARADETVNVVVITGEGRAFCAGTDIKEMAALAEGTGTADAAAGFPALMAEVVGFDKPLVAAVNGLGIGLGFTILSFCDQVFIAESARLKCPFTELGVPAEAASTALFPLRMGWQRAARVLLTAEWVDAPTAVAIGIASEVTPDAEVVERAMTFARDIAARPAASTRAIKRLMVQAELDLVRAARAREDAAFAEVFGAAGI